MFTILVQHVSAAEADGNVFEIKSDVIKQIRDRAGSEPVFPVWQNLRKALGFSWRCLMAGLHHMASTYSTPLSAVSTVVTEVHQYAGSKA